MRNAAAALKLLSLLSVSALALCSCSLLSSPSFAFSPRVVFVLGEMQLSHSVCLQNACGAAVRTCNDEAGPMRQTPLWKGWDLPHLFLSDQDGR